MFEAATASSTPASARWWSTLEDVDPISLEPLNTLPYTPFQLGCNRFDGIVLAHYILTTGTLEDPMTRASLTRADCMRLDKYVRKHMPRCKGTNKNGAHAVGACTNAFDVARMVIVKDRKQVPQSQITVRRREATAVLQNLFYVPQYKREKRNRVKQHKTERKQEARFVDPEAVQGSDGGGLVVVDDDEVFYESHNSKRQREQRLKDQQQPPAAGSPALRESAKSKAPAPCVPVQMQWGPVASAASAVNTVDEEDWVKVNKDGSVDEPLSWKKQSQSEQQQLSPAHTVCWSQSLLAWARKAPSEVTYVEKQLLNLFNSKSTSVQLKPMPAPTRKLVYELVELCGTHLVRATAYFDHSLKQRKRSQHKYMSLVKLVGSAADLPTPRLSVAAKQQQPQQPQQPQEKAEDQAAIDFWNADITTGDTAGGARWSNSRLRVKRSPVDIAAAASAAAETANQRAAAAAARVEPNVKISIYNKHDGNCIVSVPKTMAKSLGMNDETMWDEFAEQETQPEKQQQQAQQQAQQAQQLQTKGPNKSGTAVACSSSAEGTIGESFMQHYMLQQQFRHQAAAPSEREEFNKYGLEGEGEMTHLWARTTHGHACLVRTLPQSCIWV
jgi:hypothetical protein